MEPKPPDCGSIESGELVNAMMLSPSARSANPTSSSSRRPARRRAVGIVRRGNALCPEPQTSKVLMVMFGGFGKYACTLYVEQ